MAKTVSLYFAGAAGLVVDMITKEQLQGMSDFEVNKALAQMVGFNTREMPVSVCLVHQSYGWAEIDYCNIPNDIMPLAFEHKLSLHYVIDRDSGYWMAGSNTYYHCEDANPLRAIACCLILVLQEQSK